MHVQDFASHSRSPSPLRAGSPSNTDRSVEQRLAAIEKDLKSYKTKNDAAVKKAQADAKGGKAVTDLTKKVTTLETSMKKAIKDLDLAKKDIIKQLKDKGITDVKSQLNRLENQL